MKKLEIVNFINSVEYDKYKEQIIATDTNGNKTSFLDLATFERVMDMFNDNENKTNEFHEQLAKFICDAINSKILASRTIDYFAMSETTSTSKIDFAKYLQQKNKTK